MTAFHMAACLAPWTFSPAGLATALVLTLLTCQCGLCLGYHRLLCHRSFRTPLWLRHLLALLGVLAFQAGPLTWCAIHRLHHRHADTERDPQMSGRGLVWAHLLWTLRRPVLGLAGAEDVRRVTRDLQGDRVLQALERSWYEINFLLAAALFLAGWAAGGLGLALSLLVWGFFLRIVYCWHVTFLVNSLGHRRGPSVGTPSDRSANHGWLALLSFGEGWHQNHHRWPRYAAHGRRWCEIDTTYLLIRLLECVGLAWEVNHPRRGSIQDRKEGRR
jgi:stearoyl-CoA desaturase (delta-9 desaturase)